MSANFSKSDVNNRIPTTNSMTQKFGVAYLHLRLAATKRGATIPGLTRSLEGSSVRGKAHHRTCWRIYKGAHRLGAIMTDQRGRFTHRGTWVRGVLSTLVRP